MCFTEMKKKNSKILKKKNFDFFLHFHSKKVLTRKESFVSIHTYKRERREARAGVGAVVVVVVVLVVERNLFSLVQRFFFVCSVDERISIFFLLCEIKKNI